MAKIPEDEMAQMLAGFEAPVGAACPHYATSTYGEVWLLGQYLNETGRGLYGIERGRGGVYRTPSGCSFKVTHKAGASTVARIR